MNMAMKNMETLDNWQSRVCVREIPTNEHNRWEAYVESCPQATFFHRIGWKKVIEKAFGHETHYLVAEADGVIEGILPLGHIRSRLFGNALISTPFCVYGGVAANNPSAQSALIQRAEQLAVEQGVDYLELRNQTASSLDWPTKDLYVTFRKEIDSDPEKNMLAIPRKQRAMVRKGIKAGLKSEVDEDIVRFFIAYSTSVRNLGTPVFPKRYFKFLKEVFDKDCEVLTVTKNGQIVGSVLSFYFRNEVLPYYGGSTEEARRLAGNDFMYWELMRRACQQGVRLFDYGRSKKAVGSYSFKKNWGFNPTPLVYHYRLVKSNVIPNVNPLNPKYDMFVRLWKHLPLPIANTLGPLLSRNLG